MLLTGVTDAMIEKALRSQSLLPVEFHPPKGAIREVTKALHEKGCADWDHTMDEQKAWDELPPGAKQMAVDEAVWLIGRLAHERFRIVKS